MLDSMDHLADISSPQVMLQIAERLPAYLRTRWLREATVVKRRHHRQPVIEELVSFVNEAAEEANHPVYGKLTEIKDKSSQPNNYNKPNKPINTRGSNFNVSAVTRMSNSQMSNNNGQNAAKKRCQLCNVDHSLFACTKFKEMKPDKRLAFAKEHRLCFNCLLNGHMSSGCPVKRVCSVPGCMKKHTKFLHQLDNADSQRPQVQPSLTADRTLQETTSAFSQMDVNGASGTFCGATGAGASQMRIALPIIPVKVRATDRARCINTYALLDNGSTSTFCSEALLAELKLQGTKDTLAITTLEKKSQQIDTTVVSLEVSGAEGERFIDMPTVYSRAELPMSQANVAGKEDISLWPHLKDIKLPDVIFSEVGLLIGQDVPEALLPIEVVRGEAGAPYATRTQLGWAINGPLGGKGKQGVSVNFIQNDVTLESQVEKFWQIETPNPIKGGDKCMSVEDKRAVSIWEDTIKLTEGHYEMAIPFKAIPPNMPDNRVMAEKRLEHLQRRLNRDAALAEMYRDAMSDMLDKGYAEEVPESEMGRADGRVWYIPHQPVLNPNKPGKLRVVFDCAAKFQDKSLNDHVMQGPDLTNVLIGVLLRFRQDRIALMADVQSMFHQVKVTPEDKDALRFLWWPEGNTNKRPSVYRMTSHLFGGTWSPSCCAFALRRTATDHASQHSKMAVETVCRDFYVDDCLKSVGEMADGLRLGTELRELLSKGGFRLTKWVSNEREVLASIPQDEWAQDVRELDMNYEALPTERALGVFWDVEADQFRFKTVSKDKPLTRRGLLSIVSSVYDPLGLLAPFTITAKKIVQDLTRQKIGWDEELPTAQLNGWLSWTKGLNEVHMFKVSRCIRPDGFGPVKTCELHHFCDASEMAYGAVSYLRMINDKGDIHCALLMAKSRLAPIKKVTVPQLELMAATLAVKLDGILKQELDIHIDRTFFWTDSTIVLYYINDESKRFHTFVANRVATIHEGSSPAQWRHVGTKLNPADDVSRGLSIVDIASSHRWTHGPNFLWADEENWPENLITRETKDDDPEVKVQQSDTKTFLCSQDQDKNILDRLLERRSNWHSLKKDVAWLLRFKAFLKKKVAKEETPEPASKQLSVEELRLAEEAIVKYVQLKNFGKDIELLRQDAQSADKPGRKLKETSSLYKLDPQIGENGCLQVGGRLKNAPISISAKHQYIMPSDHHVTHLIVRHLHESSGHSGREHVLSLIRERYWIVNARSVIRKELNACLICRRLRAAPMQQKMADLPEDRVTPGSPPFTSVGVDYFGPFLVKQGRSLVKRYGCIFTCLVIRAVHIEVAHSLDTDSFINALQRFISRRGQPAEIRSDNGTNFVGADRELQKAIKDWNQARINNFLCQKGIDWKFNPPAASHMGGVWERQIRTSRKVLNSIMKEQTLTDEGLATLMCVAEGIINGRPLTHVSLDTRDLEPLTPNHLLLLRAGPKLPPGSFQKEDLYCRKRWRQVQYMADLFWKRWIREYLPMLQQRQKWIKPSGNLEIGDVVLIMDENAIRNCWTLGRVEETHAGPDGLVRSAKVKTSNSVLTRPIQKLCLLESVSNRY